MGMTIDEAIAEVKQQKLDFQEFWEEYKNEHIEALDMAIEIMHKYQKIEEIYKNWCYPTQINAVEAMIKIGEVLKDGNID